MSDIADLNAIRRQRAIERLEAWRIAVLAALAKVIGVSKQEG